MLPARSIAGTPTFLRHIRRKLTRNLIGHHAIKESSIRQFGQREFDSLVLIMNFVN
jgi:hypothetical protein